MSDKPRLSDAIQDYLLYRKAEGKSPSTIRSNQGVLRRFLLVCGDLYVASIGDKQVNSYLAVAAETRHGATLAIDYSVLSQFFAWAVRNRLIGRFSNPMEGRKPAKSMPKERQRVHLKDFARLLDAAGAYHPRDRMVVALGIYLFLRGSEVATLRISDVRLEDGEVFVRIWKTREVDAMPVSSDLDRELRAWLTYYTRECGPLDPDWHLVPAKRLNAVVRDPDTHLLCHTGAPALLNPERKIGQIADIPKRALSAIGYRVRDDSGESRREGMHTLRRSGARALFDTLLGSGYDGSIRQVQTMLHHASMAQTEHYIGLSLDRVKRNEIIKGRPMYDQGENVVSIDTAKRGVGGG